MVRVRVTSSHMEQLDEIKKWIDGHELPKDITTHWWFAQLPQSIKLAFSQLALDPAIRHGFENLFPSPLYTVKVLESMNEIYVAAPQTEKATSDNVFYANHVDGPFLMYPLCSLYRAIVAINENDSIQTMFPLVPCQKVLNRGDFWAFDFNREIHRIEMKQPPTGLRYTLKVHYLVYPTSLWFYGELLGRLTSLYNTLARLAFLNTLVPKTGIQKCLWALIMFSTNLFFNLIRSSGNSGALSFVGCMWLISLFAPKWPLFMISTSFVHYFIYMATYYHAPKYQGRVSFEAFKQTVMFYKAVAFGHIIYHYAKHLPTSVDYISLLMILTGFSLSTSAMMAIGVDRTYFGIELGFCKPIYVNTFPYNMFKHPMILGNLVGLMGLFKFDLFRLEYPWLIPIHMILYIVHMAQVNFLI